MISLDPLVIIIEWAIIAMLGAARIPLQGKAPVA